MKFQSYILSFLFFCFVLLFFLTGKQSMKTPMKVFIKVQRIVGTLSRMWSRYLITFKCIFSGEDDLWFFFFFNHICNINTYIQKISYFHVFIEKDHLSFSVQREDIIFSGKKYKKDHIPVQSFLEKTIFSGYLKKISYLHILFWEISSLIFLLKKKMIFSGKRNIIFPDNTRKIIFQRCLFGKRKCGFSCSLN